MATQYSNSPLSASNQSQVLRLHGREYLLQAVGREPIDVVEDATEHGAIFVEHRIVAVLEQVLLLDLRLLASQATAFDAAAHHPIDAAMPVIGAAVAVLAEGSPELADHHHDAVVPGRTDRVGKARQATTK